MDKNFIASRLKKYLFLISIIFIILTSAHLLYSYVYSDAQETPIQWGSISEAIIWDIPHLNPLKNNTQQNKYINSILYRSLLKYDIWKKKIVGDLAKCNISNLLEIECFLEQNITWSNGEKISLDDVVKTYETLKQTNINKNMYSLLQNVTITKKENSIVFKNEKKDINVLKMFFQPIVSQKVLNVISKKEMEWSFSLVNGVYSWMYKVVSIMKDETFNTTSITLERNEEYTDNPVYVDAIVFKVFPTIKDFLKNKNSVNIFNDKDNLITGTIPSLETHPYTLPQYVSLFFNTQNIKDNDLRWLITNVIDREAIVQELWEKQFQTVQNHFLTEAYIEDKPITASIAWILNKKGFFNQKSRITELEEKLAKTQQYLEKTEEEPKWISVPQETDTLISAEAKIVSEKSETASSVSTKQNAPSAVISSPNWVQKYNFVTQDNILLQGKVPSWTTAVFVWEYQLKNFVAGNSIFYYRIKTAFSNIKQWDNTYIISAIVNGEKKVLEELYFFYNSNSEIVEKKKEEVLGKPVVVETENTETQRISSEAEVSEKKIETDEKTMNEKIENNSEKVPTEKEKEASSEIGIINPEYNDVLAKIAALKSKDSRFFYNEQWETFNLDLYYISEKKDYEDTAQLIKETLEEQGIEIHLSGITTTDLKTLLSEWKKNYDMLLAWVNLSYFDFNIYSYFHSSQIDNGFNFSNYRKLDLDILLEDLKTQVLSVEKIETLQKKVLWIIDENHLSMTIYTPLLSNLVDKNIKWYSLQKRIPEKIYRFDPLKQSYIRENKVINTENKTFVGYVSFLKNLLF